MHKRSLTLLVVFLICLGAAVVYVGLPGSLSGQQPAVERVVVERTEWQIERDYICMLAAYAVVYRGWQPDNARGYNIGSVLLDNDSKDGRLVFWGRNCVTTTENKTQHGEIRLMVGYLALLHAQRDQGDSVPDITNLKGHTIYTTLEPCAQCSGMMTLLNVNRTVYGQKDPGYGKALERLQLDSRALPGGGGYGPYPRPVTSVRSDNVFCKGLEDEYDEYKKHKSNPSITDFLRTDEARAIYHFANKELMGDFKSKHRENYSFLEDTRYMLTEVSPEFVPLRPDI